MDTQERRQHSRQQHWVGSVDYKGATGVNCEQIVDIGLGGARLILSGQERPGTKVELSVQLEPEQEPVQLSGQVVWARQAPPFEAGVRFLERAADLERSLG